MSKARQLFRVAVIAAAVAITPTVHAEESQRVNFHNWNDYIDAKTLPDFTKQTGVEVIYDVYDSNQVLEAKLLAGSTGFDIVVPSNNYLLRQIKAGVFLPLDKAKLPNFKNLDPQMMKIIEAVDPGNQYGIPYMWGTTGIGYNVDKVKEILGDDAPVDSWDLIFKKENIEKLSQCGVTFLDAPTDTFPTVLNYLKLDPASTNPKDYSGIATEKLMELRPYIRYFHSSKFITDLANGDICVAIGWNGDVIQARDRAKEANNGINIAYSIPKEGAMMWFDVMAIPKDAKNVDNAHKLLNYLLEPRVMADISNYVAYANPVPASKTLINKDIIDDKGVYPNDATMAKLFTVGDLPQPVHRAMTRSWTRIRTGY